MKTKIMVPLYIVFLISLFFSSCTTTSSTLKLEPVIEISLFEKNISAAENGNLEAQVQVGISYEEGKGVTVNYDEAFIWYKRAASKGNNHAYFRLGRCYEYGISVKENMENAYEWYLSSATTGFNPAIKRMIMFYNDYPEEQLNWIKQGIKNNDPFSYYSYGLLLEKDDPDEAMNYYKKAQGTGDPDVNGLLAILSLSGKYNFYNDEEALLLLIAASDRGNSRCQVFLGWLYEFGDLLPGNSKRAFELYESAVRSNEVLAIYNLSRFYEKGIFVQSDLEWSKRFLDEIPEKFHSFAALDLESFVLNRGYKEQQLIIFRFKTLNKDLDAMYRLGLLSEPGKAFQWFYMAAHEKHIDSMIELARLYNDADNRVFNRIKAAAWLMAAENLSGVERDDFSSSMIFQKLDKNEKIEASRLFTEIFYGDLTETNDRNLVR